MIYIRPFEEAEFGEVGRVFDGSSEIMQPLLDLGRDQWPIDADR